MVKKIWDKMTIVTFQVSKENVDNFFKMLLGNGIPSEKM